MSLKNYCNPFIPLKRVTLVHPKFFAKSFPVPSGKAPKANFVKSILA
jgi:hypothetical protein